MSIGLNKKKKVLVLMSGGVDSSVVAFLLKKKGFDVSGVYLRNWEKGFEDLLGCQHAIDGEDAFKVAQKLNIPYQVWNFTKEYQQAVIDHFIEGYKKGLTPNPDIRCNQFVKFGVVLDRALEEGFDYIATGHYAKVEGGRLFTACDNDKDQTYFLSTLNQKQLKHILFPLADLTKKEVREIARKQDLNTWDKKDSTGICFVGDIKLKEFLKSFISEKKGEIIGENGKIIGDHSGAWFYTVGQRHGLGVGGGEPYFVKEIDTAKNIVYVTTRKQEKSIFSSQMKVIDFKWLSGETPKLPLHCFVRIRHQGKLVKATIEKGGQVSFTKPQRALAPGQQAVFYSLKKTKNSREILGSGVIA